MDRFHRDDNAVVGTSDRARSGIALAVLPSELSRVAVNFTRAGCVRRSAVTIGIGRVECNVERTARLMNAELEHALSIQKFFVGVFAECRWRRHRRSEGREGD